MGTFHAALTIAAVCRELEGFATSSVCSANAKGALDW